MKVFISWSGNRSLAMAQALRDWLPNVIQAVDPWMSDRDAAKGILWEKKIEEELKTRFGIFCLTTENLDSRWLNFEAGAIASGADKAYVWTYILDFEPEELRGPLSQFNHTRAEKEDTRKLILTINRALENRLDEGRLNQAFDHFWPDLAEQLNRPVPTQENRPPSVAEMTQEILISIRAVERSLRLLGSSPMPFHQTLSLGGGTNLGLGEGRESQTAVQPFENVLDDAV
ncbi:MAG TPA: hypothetical protein VN920_13245, partial [Pyrinomonadaceae bacterium]|nr:hypothetical protein [Pyrinomonadaceae bacterium]